MIFDFRRRVSILLAATLLLSGCAFADTITFSGTVAARQTHEVYAPVGGIVEAVQADVGQKVAADDVLLKLSTTKVYAEEAGTVTGVFAQPGDSAETAVQKYGAVMYIEGESAYSIDASTENAYNSASTRFVHMGETVYLSSYSDNNHTGTGVITAIEGTEYTVQVLSGKFLIGETVNIYRGTNATATKRIGRGTLNRISPTAVTGSGSIVSLAVSDGDTVERGDLLFETLEGTFSGLSATGSEISAGISGTISQISAQQGSAIQKDSVVAVIYPDDAMRIEAEVSESNLAYVAVGKPVSIELLWNQDEEVTYSGTISMISAVADAETVDSMDGDNAVMYTVYIDFTPDENTRYGMSAIVSTLDDEESEATEEAAETEVTEAEAGDDAEAEADAAREDAPEVPDEGGLPEGDETPRGERAEGRPDGARQSLPESDESNP